MSTEQTNKTTLSQVGSKSKIGKGTTPIKRRPCTFCKEMKCWPNYKEKLTNSEEEEEYTLENLVKCALKCVYKQGNSTQKYTLKALRLLIDISHSHWYDGIFEDCDRLGLNTDEILETVVDALNTNGIYAPLKLVHKNKQHLFRLESRATPPFFSHRSVDVSKIKFARFKKGGK